MMHRLQLSLVALFFLVTSFAQAQVPRRVVVEHFTNSVCSICASRNPGFFANLANNPEIIHIAVHPSSPYSSCIFNQVNPAQNDERTNFYGIYGATPRFVIQGEVQPGTVDLTSSSLFDPYRNQTSPVEIRITQTLIDPSTIEFTLVIKSVSTPDPGRHQLFFALAEDTVFYNAPNGEDLHHNVFRSRLTQQGFPSYTLPNSGDSIIVNTSATIDSGWNIDRLFGVAVLQDSATKSVLQAGQSNPGFDNQPTSILDPMSLGIDFYPNPTQQVLQLDHPAGLRGEVVIRNIQGAELQRHPIVQKQRINLTGVPAGLYMLEWHSSQGRAAARFIRQ